MKTASVNYDLSTTDKFVHITNYSLQKYNNNFNSVLLSKFFCSINLCYKNDHWAVSIEQKVFAIVNWALSIEQTEKVILISPIWAVSIEQLLVGTIDWALSREQCSKLNSAHAQFQNLLKTPSPGWIWVFWK